MGREVSPPQPPKSTSAHTAHPHPVHRTDGGPPHSQGPHSLSPKAAHGAASRPCTSTLWRDAGGGCSHGRASWLGPPSGRTLVTSLRMFLPSPHQVSHTTWGHSTSAQAHKAGEDHPRQGHGYPWLKLTNEAVPDPPILSQTERGMAATPSCPPHAKPGSPISAPWLPGLWEECHRLTRRGTPRLLSFRTRFRGSPAPVGRRRGRGKRGAWRRQHGQGPDTPRWVSAGRTHRLGLFPK